MATSDPVTILLAHDAWATREIIGVCIGLNDEQFHRRFEMGPGSLHDTVTHTIAAMRVWTDILAQREVRPRIEGTKRTLAELEQLHAEAAAELAAVAKRHPLDEVVVRVREGKSYPSTRGAVITHVTTHGMHHRAQCLNMLRHLGVNPLPMSSVIEWARSVDV